MFFVTKQEDGVRQVLEEMRALFEENQRGKKLAYFKRALNSFVFYKTTRTSKQQ